MTVRPPGHPTEDRVDLVSDAVRGARSAFEASVEHLRPALWRFCHQLTGSAWDADLVQETMQRAFARVGDLWQPAHPRAYLFRIASTSGSTVTVRRSGPTWSS
jgi:RNA polymerase sigma-70 factor, ECF subfamily